MVKTAMSHANTPSGRLNCSVSFTTAVPLVNFPPLERDRERERKREERGRKRGRVGGREGGGGRGGGGREGGREGGRREGRKEGWRDSLQYFQCCAEIIL